MNSPLFCYTPEYKPKLSSHFQTPLHLALRENNLEIIEILLAFGADPAVRDRRGNNAFHMAAVTGDAEVMRAIARSARKRGDINDFGNGGEHSKQLPAIHLFYGDVSPFSNSSELTRS